jgi:demethylmenaquinone methyltransferase / 2-methoxy-6-polyprenyl-1,4-benzoquinol methylase
MDAPTFVEPNRFAQQLFAGLPDRYDRLEAVLSLGQNARWRRAMIDSIMEPSPGAVLDVATGTAGVAMRIAARAPAAVVGLDLTESMLREGRRRLRDQALPVSLVQGRAEDLPFPDASFDALTFTYLLRYVTDPAATMRELARVVRPGGRIASLEFYVPPNVIWRGAWWFYTRAVLPAAGALAGRAWYRVGRFLGPNISGHYRRYPLDWTVRAWQDAGITDVGTRVMSLGGGLVMWGTKADG